MNTMDAIKQRLQILNPSIVELIDDSAKHAGHVGALGGGGHYRLRIVADAFVGKNSLTRHRIVYNALGDMMHHEIHALSVKAYTSDEV